MPNYSVVKTINLYLKNIIGPIAMNSVNMGAFHKSTNPTGEPAPGLELLTTTNAPLVSNISSDVCMVGIFQANSPSTTYYCVIVNKSMEHIYNIVVTLKHDYTGKITKPPSVINYTGGTTYSPVSGGTQFTIYDLQGGEGQFYKITNVTNPW
jgi:hypothetical protein